MVTETAAQTNAKRNLVTAPDAGGWHNRSTSNGRLKVVGMGSSTRKMRQTLAYPEMFAAAAPACPKCAKPMTPRSTTRPGGERYMFWGCVAFPGCLGNRPMK